MSRVGMARDIYRERARRQTAEQTAAEARAREDAAVDRYVSDAESVAESQSAVGGRDRSAAKEFAQREFGPVIETFDDVPEYPLGTPSWLARRSELEWSRKALYGQLRKWFGVQQSGCTVIKSNTALGTQIGTDRRTIGSGLKDLIGLRLIHVEGPATGIRRVYFHRHEWMADRAAVPTWAKLGQDNSAACPNLVPPLVPNWAPTCAKLDHKTSKTNKPTNLKRILAPDGEQRLFDEIASIVGAKEIKKNGGMWRNRIRGGQQEIKALRNTIEDYRARTPEQKSQIRNRGAWFTDLYMRNLVEIDKAEANRVA